jgi:hypothetical protein
MPEAVIHPGQGVMIHHGAGCRNSGVHTLEQYKHINAETVLQPVKEVVAEKIVTPIKEKK